MPKPLESKVRKVFIGWDAKEVAAYDVAACTLQKHSSQELDIVPLKLDALRKSGFLWNVGPGYGDILDDVSPSTEFSRTRFLLPFLVEHGWALYCDCDVVALGDVEEIFQLGRSNPKYALFCAHHPDLAEVGEKMGGKYQRPYGRKNWSSVILWNCGHEAHKRLSLHQINHWPRRLLHRFSWLDDDEIGTLPPSWNWLVNVQPQPKVTKLAHFTLGGPWIPGYRPSAHDDLWLDAAQSCGVAP